MILKGFSPFLRLFEVFGGQYKSGRNAVATGVAARLNNGDTVFISDRAVESTGQPFVEPPDQIVKEKNDKLYFKFTLNTLY